VEIPGQISAKINTRNPPSPLRNGQSRAWRDADYAGGRGTFIVITPSGVNITGNLPVAGSGTSTGPVNHG
jgi:hypothetical protein